MENHLSKKWYYYAGFEQAFLDSIPQQGVAFELDARSESIDIDSLLEKPGKAYDEATLVNCFSLQEDMPLAFGGSCDYWFEVWLNGTLLYSTFPNGNSALFYETNIQTFAAAGKKGENKLVVHVRRGSGSWTFAFAEKDSSCGDAVSPLLIVPNPEHELGIIKPMNAVNNGPIKAQNTQVLENFDLWKAAKIPFARNHDAGFYESYGGAHTVDVHVIFPDFNADPEDPASYDFDLTDEYVQTTLEAGTQTVYRLGSKIEPKSRKYGTVVPPDFKKWAVICEHIIRHLNEGWANGHHFNIMYWEIWNEPDLGRPEYKPTWQGTQQEFFELFRVAASHLKKCFPNLKIGGPAVANYKPWVHQFLAFARENHVPLDFFSWHMYGTQPKAVQALAFQVRRVLDSYGYTKTENHLNEFNYVRDWGKGFKDTIRTIIGLKGAIFTAASMCAGQLSPLDMLMYYDARPCAFNGIFDCYTLEPLKTYYVFLAWSKLVELGTCFEVDIQDKKGIYAVGATDGKGRNGILITRFFEEDSPVLPLSVTLQIPGTRPESAKLFLLDETHDLTEVPANLNDHSLNWTMRANTMVYIEYQLQ